MTGQPEASLPFGQNTDGRRALDAAKSQKLESVVSILIERGAKPGIEQRSNYVRHSQSSPPATDSSTNGRLPRRVNKCDAPRGTDWSPLV